MSNNIITEYIEKFKASLSKKELAEFNAYNFEDWYLKDLLKETIIDKRETFKEKVFNIINNIKLNELSSY